MAITSGKETAFGYECAIVVDICISMVHAWLERKWKFFNGTTSYKRPTTKALQKHTGVDPKN